MIYGKHKTPVDRILIIFKKFYDKEHIDIYVAAEEFNVSTRTILRDIKIIKKIIPIKNNRKGDYSLTE